MLYLLNSKLMVFGFGGAILGFTLFKTPESAIIGAIFGVLLCFVR